MNPHLPVEDPSQGTSLLDLAVGQVRQSLLLEGSPPVGQARP